MSNPLQLSIKGYNDKQHVLLSKIMDKMTNFTVDQQRFDILKEAVSHSGHGLAPAVSRKVEGY